MRYSGRGSKSDCGFVLAGRSDFRSTGIAFIYLAWDSIISVALNLSAAPVESCGDENDAETIASWRTALDGYLQSAQQELATAVALAQQGTEFLLKSKI